MILDLLTIHVPLTNEFLVFGMEVTSGGAALDCVQIVRHGLGACPWTNWDGENI